MSDPMDNTETEKRNGSKRVTFSSLALKQYEKTYGIVGNHSGVQVCHWNNLAIKGKGSCYKTKFYGIDCHKCCQMSPALAWCTESCIFCWRPSEWMKKTDFGRSDVDAPDEIIQETVRIRKLLVSGIGGAAGADKMLFKEAFGEFPSHWAISLSGEPMIYPRLGELIKGLKSRKEVRTIFLVTNGQHPGHIAQLAGQDALPTQLYVSISAPNEELFGRINKPAYDDGWKRLNRTLELLAKLKCRRVIRFTLIKGVNDEPAFLAGYAALLEKSKVDFIEVKSYMALGFSRRRLGVANMCRHEYIKEFSAALARLLPEYGIVNEDERSKIVLLKRKDSKYESMINTRQCGTGR